MWPVASASCKARTQGAGLLDTGVWIVTRGAEFDVEQGAGGRTGAVWGGAAILLLLPWLAMQFTDEVAWDLADFIVFGALLSAACGAWQLAASPGRGAAYRAAAGVAIASAFILIWSNLAVGILGNEDNPANLLFGLVLVVGVAGAAVVRLRPHGMTRVLAATALAQALVAVIALAAGLGNALMPSGFFVALWLASAWLFRRAAREQDHRGT